MTNDPLRQDTAEARAHPRPGALAVLATAQLVLALDYSIVNVALPSIGGSLGFSRDAVEWVVSAYALMFGGFLLLGGRSSDLLGRRRVFMASGTLFGLASMVGGLSTTPAMLLAGRAVQGLAGGFLFPATLSLVTSTFPEGPSRNRAISVWGAAGAGGLAFGAFLGGVLTTALGWRWVFFVNVPVLAAIVVAAPLLLPGRRPPRPRVADFDVPGAACVTAGALLVVLALVQAPVVGWASPATVIPAAVGLVLLGAFLWIEHRSRDPLMPLELLRRRTLGGGMLVTAAFMASFGLQFFFLTLYLQSSLHETPLIAGISFLPLALLIVAGNRVGGRLASRYGPARLLPPGMLIGAVGLLTYVLLGPKLSLPTLLVGEVIAGFGQGIVFTAAYLVAESGVEADRQGVASGMASTAQQLGGSIGLAVLVDLLSAGLGASKASGLVLDGTPIPGLLHALHLVYAAQAGIALLGAVAAALVIDRRSGRPGERGRASVAVAPSEQGPVSHEPAGNASPPAAAGRGS
jgi:EmrB/QacA subfamily drug resistance transporter